MSKTSKGGHAGFVDKKSVKSDVEMSGKQVLLLIYYFSDFICSELHPDLWCQPLFKKDICYFCYV